MDTCVRFARLLLVLIVLNTVCAVLGVGAFDIDKTFKRISTEEVNILSRWFENEDRVVMPQYSQCPPPPRPLYPAACDVSTCGGDHQCAFKFNSTYVCCFNGCVKTCTQAVDPPPVIDWVDEPPEFKKIIVPSREEQASAPEVVAIPGGCLITPAQYNRLQAFKSNEHISDCFCAVGGVLCEVNKI